jgi:hypothetical protein
MGFLDELKDRAEEFGDKAKEGFGAAKDKTEEVIENVQDRFDGDETPAEKDAAAEPDEAAIDNATRAAPNLGDTKAGSESW